MELEDRHWRRSNVLPFELPAHLCYTKDLSEYYNFNNLINLFEYMIGNRTSYIRLPFSRLAIPTCLAGVDRYVCTP